MDRLPRWAKDGVTSIELVGSLFQAYVYKSEKEDASYDNTINIDPGIVDIEYE